MSKYKTSFFLLLLLLLLSLVILFAFVKVVSYTGGCYTLATCMYRFDGIFDSSGADDKTAPLLISFT